MANSLSIVFLFLLPRFLPLFLGIMISGSVSGVLLLFDDLTSTAETLELNEDDLMTGAEQRIFENLEAGEEIPPAQRTSYTTNVLNLNQIKNPIVSQQNLEIVQYVEFQLSPPLASITPSTSNKRSTPDTEPDIIIPKKRGRKRGSKNKKTIERELAMSS